MKRTHLLKMVLPTIILTFSLCAHAQRGAPPLGSKATDPDAYYISDYNIIGRVNLDHVDSSGRLIRRFPDGWTVLGDFFHDGRQAVAYSWHETFWVEGGGFSVDSNWVSIVRGYGPRGQKPDTVAVMDSIPGMLVAIGDFDANGYTDLVLWHNESGTPNPAVTTLRVLYFDSTGIWRTQLLSPVASSSEALIGDWNGDGVTDIIGGINGELLQVYGKRGVGLDSATAVKKTGFGDQNLYGDFNQDGIEDVLAIADWRGTGEELYLLLGSRDSGLSRVQPIGGPRGITSHIGVASVFGGQESDIVFSRPSSYTYIHHNDFTGLDDTTKKEVGTIYAVPAGPDILTRPWFDSAGKFWPAGARAYTIPEPTLLEPDLNWTYNYWQSTVGSFGGIDGQWWDNAGWDLGSLSKDSDCHVLAVYTSNGQFLYSCGPALDQLADAYIDRTAGGGGVPIGDWDRDGYNDIAVGKTLYDDHYTANRYYLMILPGGEYIPHIRRQPLKTVTHPSTGGIWSVSVYPNPSVGEDQKLDVVLTRPSRITVTLRDLLGKTLLTIGSDDAEYEHLLPLGTSALSPSTYFLTVESADGVATTKLVISH